MPNYDFNNVFAYSPLRFQQFACAVVSEREGCIFQRFGEGKDGGIDGLYSSDDGDVILQSKRTKMNGTALVRLLSQERNRMKDISCGRYILVLAVRSVEKKIKDQIREIFPEIQTTGDIITGEDLNGYLERPEYGYIEKEYHELWLQSGNQLDEILSQSMLKELRKKSNVDITLMEKGNKTFVPTAVFQEALKVLEKYRRVIISGEPGAGKTAHAYNLAHYYLKEAGYEELYFVNSLSEVERLLGEDDQRKRVIVFDDFWGHNTFSEGRIELNAEQKLQKIFAALKYYPAIRLILTTREFVLQQGLRCFPEVEELCEIEKVNLKLSEYTLAQRAEILFRHLEQSSLEFDYQKEIFLSGSQIVHCGAYSPRSVVYYLENVKPDEVSPKKYAENLVQYVKNPKKFFDSIFKQLSFGARMICFLILLSEEEIRIGCELKQGFMRLADGCKGEIEKERFEEYLKEAESVFVEVRESWYEEILVLDFLNYSIRDYMREYLNSHIEVYGLILARDCIYYNQLYYLITEIELTDECAVIVQNRLMTERKHLKYSYVFNMEVDRNYQMDAKPEDYDSHKIWQLILLYEKTGNIELFHYLKESCDFLLKKLEEGNMLHHDMEAVADLIPRMCQNGYKIDEYQLLKQYYKNIRWAVEIRYLEILGICCPAYYEKFIDEVREEIRRCLPDMILDDIEDLLDEPDGDMEIDLLMMEVQDLFQGYDIPYTDAYEKELYYTAERPLPGTKKEKTSTEVYDTVVDEYELEEENYEKVTKIAREWLIPKEVCLTSKEIKAIERQSGKDYRKRYLTKGKFSRDDFGLVMSYLGTLEKVPVKEETFYTGLSEYLLSGCDEEEAGQISHMARKLAEREIFFFTDRTLERWEECRNSTQLSEKLLSAGILHRTGKWYHFWNRSFLRFLALKDISGLEEMTQKRYYQEEIWNYWSDENTDSWIRFLKEWRYKEFNKYIVIPCFSEYLENMQDLSREERAYFALECMKLEGECCKDSSGEVYASAIYYVADVFTVLNLLNGQILEEVVNSFEDMIVSLYDRGEDLSAFQENREYVSVYKMIQSEKGRAYLKEYGCIDVAGELIRIMEEYIIL